MSAGNRNEYRQELVAFAIGASGRIACSATRLYTWPKSDAKADCRRKRRAMTEAELVKLLDVARRRPLLDARTVRRGARKGEAVANVRDRDAARNSNYSDESERRSTRRLY